MLDFLPTGYPATSIAVQGRLLYSTGYNSTLDYSFACYDINNPRDIRFLSSRASLPNTYTLAIDGDILYTGRNTTAQGFNSYNVQNPFGLNLPGVYLDYIATDGFITDIEPEGHLVYYTAYKSISEHGLVVIDARDPTNLIQIVTDWESSNALGLTINGHFAYIAASYEGFYVLNITDKYSPVEVGYVSISSNATDVIVDGRYAYVVAGTDGVFVIDIFNPASPTIIGHIDTPGMARQLVKKGNTLFVADGPTGAIIIDVANPTHPVYVATINPSAYTWDIALYGGDLVLGTSAGLYTYRCGFLGNFEVDWFDTSLGISAYDIRVQGNIAYIAAGSDGFYTIDISNPKHPVILDLYPSPTGTFFQALDIYGQFAIVVDNSMIFTFDISNPANIKLTRTETGTDIEDATMNGPLCYVAFGDPATAGFAILNYTYAYGNGFVNNVFYGTNISTIAVQGKHVYTGDNTALIGTTPYIYTISPNPFIPVFSGSYASVWELSQDIFIDGDLMYLSDTNWLVFYNVTDPTNPIWFGDVRFNESFIMSFGVWADGPLVVNAAGHDGVYLLNSTSYIDYPGSITIPGTHNIYVSGARKIVTSGDYTYVANTTSLVILRHFKSAGATFTSGTAIAQSTEIDIVNARIKTATLIVADYIQADTNIIYYLSANGGVNWETVTPGTKHIFINTGNDLRWKAEIIGQSYRSAYLYHVAIDYEYSTFIDFLTAKWINLPIWAWFVIGIGGLIIIITSITLIAKAAKKKRIRTR